MNLFDKVFPPRTITLANGKQMKKPRSRAPLYAVVLLVMAAVSVEVTGFDLGVLVSRIGEFIGVQLSIKIDKDVKAIGFDFE